MTAFGLVMLGKLVLLLVFVYFFAVVASLCLNPARSQSLCCLDHCPRLCIRTLPNHLNSPVSSVSLSFFFRFFIMMMTKRLVQVPLKASSGTKRGYKK